VNPYLLSAALFFVAASAQFGAWYLRPGRAALITLDVCAALSGAIALLILIAV
jgi:hypothetical protein